METAPPLMERGGEAWRPDTWKSFCLSLTLFSHYFHKGRVMLGLQTNWLLARVSEEGLYNEWGRTMVLLKGRGGYRGVGVGDMGHAWRRKVLLKNF